MPAAASTWFNSISSRDHRLRLHHALDVVLSGDVEHILIRLRGVPGPEHRRPVGGHLLLELDQQLVEIGDGVLFDLVGRLAPVLEIGDGVGRRPVVLARPFGRLAQRLGRGRLGKPVGAVLEELGAVEMDVLGRHVDYCGMTAVRFAASFSRLTTFRPDSFCRF